ncbi:SLC13 family permease [Streptomyces sp. NPDC006385]|uniref:SLC13 family permease n=1 Tax=Streptomyces sp. NPDC006385 TaxID=3156761 RepID=UPI0033AB494C
MTYLISIAALVAVFAIATVRPVNMGILGFAAAFIVGGWVSGISIEDIQSFFPGDMFLVVFGITLLFGVARANGTIDLIMNAALKLVHGKPWAIVWLMFALAAALMSLGSVLAVGMLAPMAMPLARKYRIDPLLMGMMLSHGALAAAFSPVTVYSVGIGELTRDQGIHVSPLVLFIVPFLLNLLIAAVLFFVRGRGLLRSTESITTEDLVAEAAGGGATSRPADGTGATIATPRPTTLVTEPTVAKARGDRFTLDHWLTFAAIGGLLVAALLTIDVGVTSTCLGAFLLLASPRYVEPAMKSISWPAVLLVCGVVTYMGVLTHNGTLEYVGQKATELPWPLLTALLLCVAVGLISAVGSSLGIILIALPVAAPLLTQGGLGAAGFVVALAFCATVVDVSPFSTNGVIVLASAQVEDRMRFQRQMLRYCGYVVVTAPLLAWATVLVPTSV